MKQLSERWERLGAVKTYKLIIAALVCAVAIPLAFVVQLLLAR